VSVSIRKILLAALVASVGLAGSARLAWAGLFSATGPVIAILADELYVGEAIGHLSGAGTLAIHSQKSPAVSCVGQFTSSALHGGVGKMSCTDGATATFKFKRLNIFRGHGDGNFSRGSMSFVYGLTHAQSEPYLKLPVGKKLAHNGTELTLVDL